MDSITIIKDIADILVKMGALGGGIWAIYKIREYRELKQRIQLKIDATMCKLASAEHVAAFNWDKSGNRLTTAVELRTHAIEILLTFTNKGFRRMRLFNVQVGVNTMREHDEAEFDQNDGHLHLMRIYTSGNIVPIFRVEVEPPALKRFIRRVLRVKSSPTFAVRRPPMFGVGLHLAEDIDRGDTGRLGEQFQANNVTLTQNARVNRTGSNWIIVDGDKKYFVRRENQTLNVFAVKFKPTERTSFYYIEPGVEQTITYLVLITEPREIIQAHAKFSLEQERIFPARDRKSKGIYPHTAARTYKINSDGSLVK